MAEKQAVFAAPVWRGAEYSRVPPGTYTAFATKTKGPEWCHAFRRYSFMVEFELLGESEAVRVCLFLNLGSDPKKPPGRMSNFYKAWTVANGDHPKRGQRMDFDVFVQGQEYVIEVGPVGHDSDQRTKSDDEVYSTVRRIISARFMNLESLNRESKIRNHPIKQSTNQVGQ